MGYKEWRERQIAKVDAMTARADERYEQAKAREVEARQEAERAREERAQDASDRQLEWFRARAREWGEDHDDLLARAEAVGMGPPVLSGGGVTKFVQGVEKATRLPGRDLVYAVSGGIGTPGGIDQPDPYRAWRDRIVIEEVMAAKIARGEQLSRKDRAVLRIARYGSKS